MDLEQMSPEELVMTNHLLACAFQSDVIRTDCRRKMNEPNTIRWMLQVKIFSVWITLISADVSQN